MKETGQIIRNSSEVLMFHYTSVQHHQLNVHKSISQLTLQLQLYGETLSRSRGPAKVLLFLPSIFLLPSMCTLLSLLATQVRIQVRYKVAGSLITSSSLQRVVKGSRYYRRHTEKHRELLLARHQSSLLTRLALDQKSYWPVSWFGI